MIVCDEIYIFQFIAKKVEVLVMDEKCETLSINESINQSITWFVALHIFSLSGFFFANIGIQLQLLIIFCKTASYLKNNKL